MGRAEAFAEKFNFKTAYGCYDDLVNDPDVGKKQVFSFTLNF